MNFKTLIITLFFVFPTLIFAQEAENPSQKKYLQAIDEVLTKVDELDTPVLKNAEWQSFTKNYTQFLRGYVICTIIGDDKMVREWLSFYQNNHLNQFPTDEETVLDAGDEEKITNFLEKVREIKEKI